MNDYTTSASTGANEALADLSETAIRDAGFMEPRSMDRWTWENTNACRVYESTSHLHAYIDETQPDAYPMERHSGKRSTRMGSQSSSNGYDWDAGVKWTAALQMSRNGWTEGAESLASLSATLAPTLAPVQSIAYDVAGSYVDVGRFVDGVPECMVRYEDTLELAPSGSGQFVRIVAGINANGDVTAPTFQRFARSMAALVDALEASGRRVEVWAATTSRAPYATGETTATELVNVKEFDAPPDLANLAFWLGHPCAFRRIGFALRERLGVAGVERYDIAGASYGYSVPTPAYFTTGAIHASLATHAGQFYSDDAARRWIAQQLKLQGIELEDQS